MRLTRNAWLFVLLIGCGAPAAPPEEARTSPAELMCAGRTRAECGTETAECEARFGELVPLCARTFVEASGLTTFDAEQREMVGGLAIICSGVVYREERALAGQPCTGEVELEERYRSICLLCSVAAGTRRIASDDEEASAAPSER